MTKITNLLPKEDQQDLKLELMAGQVFRFWAYILASFVVLSGLGMGMVFVLEQRIAASNNEIDSKRQSLNSSATRQLEQEVVTLNDQIRLLNSLYANHYYWSKTLTELSYMVDSGTRLTTVQMDRATGKVTVQGEADDRDSVLSFWSRVMKSEVFKDINFPLTNLESNVGPEFTFEFYIKPEEVKKP